MISPLFCVLFLVFLHPRRSLASQERPFAFDVHAALRNLPCLFPDSIFSSSAATASLADGRLCPDGAAAAQLAHWLCLVVASFVLAPLAAFAAFPPQGKAFGSPPPFGCHLSPMRTRAIPGPVFVCQSSVE